MSNTPAQPIDITGLLRDGRHFAERREGRVHIIDSLTGNTFIMYNASQDGALPTNLVEHVLPTGVKIWVEQGREPSPNEIRQQVAYSPHLISEICQKIAEGSSITKICTEEGMPRYAQLRMWARTHPWIDQELEKARRDRAEAYRDKAIQEAEQAVSKDPVDAAALKVDTYKWGASMDHERYNPKTKVEASINTPTQIVVFTGIDRTQPRDVTQIPEEDRRG